MKAIKFLSRSLVMILQIEKDGVVTAFVQQSSQEEEVRIIRSSGPNTVDNFLLIVEEIADLTPLDILCIAVALRIPLPEEIVRNWFLTSGILTRIAECWGLQECA